MGCVKKRVGDERVGGYCIKRMWGCSNRYIMARPYSPTLAVTASKSTEMVEDKTIISTIRR